MHSDPRFMFIGVAERKSAVYTWNGSTCFLHRSVDIIGGKRTDEFHEDEANVKAKECWPAGGGVWCQRLSSRKERDRRNFIFNSSLTSPQSRGLPTLMTRSVNRVQGISRSHILLLLYRNVHCGAQIVLEYRVSFLPTSIVQHEDSFP